LQYRAGGIYVHVPNLGTMPVASMGSRFLARLVDGVIIGIPLGIVYAIVSGIMIKNATDQMNRDIANGSTPTQPGLGALSMFLILGLGMTVLTAAYEISFIATTGRTLGKQIVGVKVVSQHTGQAPGVGAAFARWGVMFGPMIVPCLGPLVTLLVELSPLFDQQARRGWHDSAAKTLVISTQKTNFSAR